MARRFLCDTNVPVYAVGAPHRYREACRAIISAQGEGSLAGEVTPVVVVEFAHQRLRQTGDRDEAGRRAREIACVFTVRMIDAVDVELALDLYARPGPLDAFDALLAGCALNAGLDVVVSADRAFDSVEGLERIDPLDSNGIEALAI